MRLSLQQLDTHEGFEALFLRKLTFEEDYDFLFRYIKTKEERIERLTVSSIYAILFSFVYLSNFIG